MKIDSLKSTIEHFRLGGMSGLAERMERRECGPCTFCCTAKGITDMKPEPKPCWKPCPNACPSGCSIYEAKPPTCTEYYCAWRLGLGGEGSRPDLTGVMVDVETIGDQIPDMPSTLGLLIHARGPYRSIPIRRMIRDWFDSGHIHVGFTTLREDIDGALIAYMGHEDDIAKALARHAGRGETGWNEKSGADVPLVEYSTTQKRLKGGF